MLDYYIKCLKEGDISALEYIYTKTKNSVFAIGFSILKDYQLSEDLMHNVYIHVNANISNYKMGTNAHAWINTIAKNMAINVYNRRKKEMLTDFDEVNLHKAEELLVPDELGLVKLVLNKLNGIESKIVIMHTIGNMKLVEIARLFDKPEGTIRWQYNNALKKLRKIINKGGFEL